MKRNYNDYSKASDLLLSWGVVIFLITSFIFKSQELRVIEIINEISQYVLAIGIILHFLAQNIKLRNPEMIKVWIETEKIPPSDHGHIGRYFYFPAHSVPRSGDKVRVEDETLPTGSALIRITDKQFIFIKDKFVAVKLYCLV